MTRLSQVTAIPGVLLLLTLCGSPMVRAQDVFSTSDTVPVMPAEPMIGASSCIFGDLPDRLSLKEAVERALCGNPETRAAWTEIKAQATSLGVAKSAYLPTLTATGQEVRTGTKTRVNNQTDLDSSDFDNAYTASVSFSWVLYDFGGREAALDNAVELIAAAKANLNATLQATLLGAAKAYYALQAASGALAAAEETEAFAQRTLRAAQGRVDKGLAPISDSLQAETATVQAAVNRAKAWSERQRAMGALDAAMMLRPDQTLVLPAVEEGVKPDKDFDRDVVALINDAVKNHPDVLVAERQARAADADIRQVEAEGLPRISLTGQSSRNNQGIAAAQGTPFYPAVTQSTYIGIEVSVPLFEGFARSYKIRQAEAQAEEKRARLEGARRKAASDFWSSYNDLILSVTIVENDRRLLDIASTSFSVASRRYETGAGTILELLSTQSTLADARREAIRAETDWRISRLDLAAKLGRLDMTDLE